MKFKIDLKFKIGNLKFKRFTRRRLLTFISTLLVLVIGSFTFLRLTQPATAAWYSDSWGFRKKLTIDYTKVSGGADLTNFPVLVSLTDLNLTKAQSTGNDIVFTSSDGSTKLDHEIEKFTQSSGELVAWVEIPTLSYTANTIIYIYYGNPSAPDQSNKTGVWDANYVAVYHLSETSGNHLNSTSVASLDSSSIAVTQQGTATGKADGADEFDGTNDLVSVSDNSNLEPTGDMTVESWIKLDQIPSVKGEELWSVVKKHSVSPWSSYFIQVWTTDKLGFSWINTSGTQYQRSGNTSVTNSSWIYAVGVKNSTTLSVYFNGNNDDGWTSGPTTGTLYASDSTFNIGAGWSGGQRTDGITDEVRLSNSARTAGWIATTYNTINSPSTFFSKGSEEKNRQPVLNFGFDEGYGTTAEDSSPGNNDGTLAGATTPSWQAEDLCISGKCLYFNGSTASVTVANTVNNVQSVSFWVKPKTNGETLLDLDGGTHYISASAGTISATGFSTPTIYVNGVSGAPLVANTWQHIIVTTATKFNASSIKIGNVSAAYLNGFIDEFKIYDYARSAAQVKTDYAGRSAPSGAAAAFNPDASFLSQGLVGYWKMDDSGVDAEGETSTDSSGNGNNGTLYGDNGVGDNGTGLDCTASGKFGTGCSLDGTDDYVAIGNGTGSIPELTYSAWINTTTTSTAQFIIANSGTNVNFRINTSGGLATKIQTDSTDSTSRSANSILSANTWINVAMTYSDSGDRKTRLYLNGSEVSYLDQTAATGTRAQYTNEFRISNSSSPFNGKIDETRIYNRALSPSEVSQLYSWAPGPIAHYKLDEATGNAVNDSSGNWSSVNWSGTGSPHWINGKFGSAGKFNGTDDRIIVGDISSKLNLQSTDPPSFTFSAWMKAESGITNYAGLKLKGGDGTGEARILFNTSGYCTTCYLFQLTPGSTVSQMPVSASYGTWYYVTGIYNQANHTQYLYINGIYQDSDVAADYDLSGSAMNFTIGYNQWYFKGGIDDVRVYNYIRTPGQIIEDMNAGHPAPGSPIGSAVAHWEFDEGYSTTANDSSNNSNSLTLSSASWTNSGKFAKAWNGTGALWLSRADDADFDFSATEDLTTSLWFKSDSATNPSATEYLLNKANATTAGYAVYANTSGQICFGIDDDTTWNPDIASCTTTDYYDGTWHHASAVRNTTADETRIYIDAVSRDSDSDTTTATLANSLSLYLGDRDATDNGDEFNGDLDEVKIFRSALTADQIKLLYNQSKATVFGAVSTDSSNNPSFSSTDSYCPPGQGSTCTAPVAEWTFNEGTGTSVNDSSGNAYTLTWNGTGSHWASGKIDKAGLFNDATADWLLGSTSLNLSGDFTIESWFKSTEAPANQQFLINKRRTSGNLEYTIRIENTDNKLNFIVWNTINGQFLTTEHPTAIAGDNTWHYFVGTVSGTTMTLYLDGVETAKSASTTGTRNGAHSDPFEIGGANSASLWNGHVDQVKIYNYARTPAQIAWDYNQGAPLAHWRFNECTGTTANDSSGNSYTGTIYPVTLGNTAVGTCSSGVSTEMWNNGTTGKRNASLDLDGTDDYIQVADTANLRFDASTQDFSIFAWVKRNTSGAAQYIISKEDADNDGYRLQFDSGNTVTCSVDTIDITSTSTITDTNWHSLGCVIDRDGNGQVYIDAKPDGSAVAISSEAMATTANIRLGTRAYTSTNYLDGQIDEVKIFNYALTAQQVRDLFNEGAVHFGN